MGRFYNLLSTIAKRWSFERDEYYLDDVLELLTFGLIFFGLSKAAEYLERLNRAVMIKKDEENG